MEEDNDEETTFNRIRFTGFWVFLVFHSMGWESPAYVGENGRAGFEEKHC
jgi:hypothetical protein